MRPDTTYVCALALLALACGEPAVTPGGAPPTCKLTAKTDGTSELDCGGTKTTIADATKQDCTLTPKEGGASELTCAGTSVTVGGPQGAACTLVDEGDGTATLTCGATTVRVSLVAAGVDVERVVGNVIIENSLDYERYRLVREVTGSLVLSDLNGMTAVTFPELVTVGSELNLSPQTTLQTASFPKLQKTGNLFLNGVPGDRTGSALSFSAPALAAASNVAVSACGTCTLDFASLARVTSLSISGNFGVQAAFVFPKLVEVIEGLGVTSNSGVGTVSLPLLETIGGSLYLSASSFAIEAPRLTRALEVLADQSNPSPSLRTLSLPALATVSLVRLQALADLETLSLPALTSVSSALVLTNLGALTSVTIGARTAGEVNLYSLAKLRTASFPNLEEAGSQFAVTDNPELVTLEAPELAKAGTFTVVSNPKLSQCAVDALAGQITTPGAQIAKDGNLRCD